MNVRAWLRRSALVSDAMRLAMNSASAVLNGSRLSSRHRSGLTVRALHHYDQIGLVVPSVRTSGGHRLYTSADLVVLYEVTAMRQLGLSLEQAGNLLAERTDVRKVIDQQLEHVDRQIRMAQRLRKQLLAARDADDAGFAEIIRLTGDLTSYMGQEKLDAMHRRIGELGAVAEHAVGVEMPRLYDEALEEMRSGTPPSDPAVRRIVDRLDELSELIRGPDSEIGAAVRVLWVDRGRQQPPGHGGADWGELVAYLDRARAAR
jgi:MerR family transcriptional regulator, thiopeptide resistance regulator